MSILPFFFFFLGPFSHYTQCICAGYSEFFWLKFSAGALSGKTRGGEFSRNKHLLTLGRYLFQECLTPWALPYNFF
jgi:hypothetical protein